MRGSIQKRQGKRGTTWQVRVEYPADPSTGKRVQRAESFATEDDAEIRLAEWLVELHRGTAIDPTTMSVAEYLRHWLAYEVRDTVRLTTFRSYEQQAHNHLIPRLGHHKLAKLRPVHVQAALADMREGARADGRAGRLAASSLHTIRRVLVTALTHAVRTGLIATNPATMTAHVTRSRQAKIDVWDAIQLRRFLDYTTEGGAAATPAPWGPIWLLAIATGMRAGEILGLSWRDIDLDRHRLHITQILTTTSTSAAPVFGEPKTRAARRVIPLDSTSVAAVRSHQRAQAEARQCYGTAWRDYDLVCTVAGGGPINHSNLRRHFKRLAARAGLPIIRFHDLRHSHATLLLRQGVPVKIVSERLGHAGISITLDTYSHVLPDMQQMAVDAIEMGLFPGAREQTVNDSPDHDAQPLA